MSKYDFFYNNKDEINIFKKTDTKDKLLQWYHYKYLY